MFNYSSNSRNKVHISGMIKYCIMNECSKVVVVVVVVVVVGVVVVVVVLVVVVVVVVLVVVVVVVVVVLVVVVVGLCTIMVLISKSMLVASNTIQDRIKMKKFNNDSFQKCYSF